MKSMESSNTNNKPNGFLKVLLFLAIIIALIGFSFFGFKSHKDKSDVHSYEYHGYNVINISNDWYIQIKIPGKNASHAIEMRYGPMEVESIPFDNKIRETIGKSKMIYLTIDPDMSSKAVIGMIEVARITGNKYNLYNIPSSSGLTRPVELIEGENSETPIIDCKNASETTTVILFRNGNITEVKKEGSCIIVQGKDDDEIIKASDILAYNLIGVI